MAKTELIEARYGRLLVRLGAFPVRRGSADADALETARVILEQGGLLALFPEGTRIRDPEELGHPKRGAGRLALETGRAAGARGDHGHGEAVPRPASRSRAGCRSRSREPIPVAALAVTPEARRRSWSRARLWPEVEDEYRRLRARPTSSPRAWPRWASGGGLLVQRRVAALAQALAAAVAQVNYEQ